MRSGRVDGHLLEWGPQRGRLTREFAALVDELGIRDELITRRRPAALRLPQRRPARVPFSIGAFMSPRTS
jgi:protoporphyrinogen/coproporphyrinogen III oxidase